MENISITIHNIWLGESQPCVFMLFFPPPFIQTITVLKGKISELQWNIMNQEMQMTSQDSQKQELMEQLDIEKK